MAKKPRNVPTTEEEDVESILRSKEAELIGLIEAVVNGEANTDVMLASMVEGEPERVRIAIVEKLRAMMEERDREKESALQQAIDAQKKQAIEGQRKTMRQWLAWVMSETTLKKLRLAALVPLLQQQGVKDIGRMLAEKGVTLSLSSTNRKELGQLSNLTQQAKDTSRERGR